MNRIHPSIVAGALALVPLVEPRIHAQSQIVFDNTPNLINQTPVFFSGNEYGDELALAGTARYVTAFSFAYYGNFGSNPRSGNIRFYANDGTDAFPGAPTALRPRSLLWDSGPLALSKGVNSINLSVPEIPVPDKFTWSVTFNGVDGTVGNQAALMLATPATIGAVLPGNATLPDIVGSYDDFWKNDDFGAGTTVWNLYNFGFGPTDPKGTFYAKVTAILAPGKLQITRTTVPKSPNPKVEQAVLSWYDVDSAYVLQSRDSLEVGEWSKVTPDPIPKAGLNLVTISVDPLSASRFYRLVPKKP